MSTLDIDRINSLLLEQQAQLPASDARVRTLCHLVGELVQLLRIPVQSPRTTCMIFRMNSAPENN